MLTNPESPDPGKPEGEPESRALPWLDTLPAGLTLRVWWDRGHGHAVVFSSSAKWLHPLFELERFLSDYLAGHPDCRPADLVLRDRVIGRGAAFLIMRMGIVRVHTDLASRRATSLFSRWNLSLDTGKVVDRIDCQTEDLLADIHNMDTAWVLLSERRRLALARLSGT